MEFITRRRIATLEEVIRKQQEVNIKVVKVCCAGCFEKGIEVEIEGESLHFIIEGNKAKAK